MYVYKYEYLLFFFVVDIEQELGDNICRVHISF